MTEVQSMAQADTSPTAGSNGGARRVLLVEPDPAICSLLQPGLAREGFEVVQVSTAAEALRRLSETPLPMAILSDVALEGMGGFVLCAHLRSDPRTARVPFLLISRTRDEDHLAKAAGAGADEYLSSPLLVSDVVTRVKLECGERSESGTIEAHTDRLPLPELTRALLAGMRTGKVALKADNAFFVFRRGKVIDAHFGSVEGEAALSRMLTLSTGEYTVTYSPGMARGTSALGPERFASHVLPKVRKGQQFLEQGVPAGSRLVVNFAALKGVLDQLPEDVNRLIRLFDGKRTLRQVAIECPLDETATLEVIQRLHGMNVLGAADSEPALDVPRRLTTPFLEPASPPGQAATGPLSPSSQRDAPDALDQAWYERLEHQLIGNGSKGVLSAPALVPDLSPAEALRGTLEQGVVPGESAPGLAGKLAAVAVEPESAAPSLSGETALFGAQTLKAALPDPGGVEPNILVSAVRAAPPAELEPAPAEPEPAAAASPAEEPSPSSGDASVEPEAPEPAPAEEPGSWPTPVEEPPPSEQPPVDAAAEPEAVTGSASAADGDSLYERFSRGDSLTDGPPLADDPSMDELAALATGRSGKRRMLLGALAVGVAVALLAVFLWPSGQHPAGSTASPARAEADTPKGTGPDKPLAVIPDKPLAVAPDKSTGTTPAPDKVATPAPDKVATPAPDKVATPAPDKMATPAPDKVATPAPDKVATPAPDKAVPPAPDKALAAVPDTLNGRLPDKVTPPAPDKSNGKLPDKVTTPTPDVPQVAEVEKDVPTLEQGKDLYDAGRTAEAVKALSKVVAARPLSTPAWLLLGMAKFDANDSRGAEEAAMKVLTLDPKNGRAMMLMASVYLLRQQRLQAEAQLKNYLALEPNGTFAHEAKNLLSRLHR